MGTKIASDLGMKFAPLFAIALLGGCPTAPPEIETTIDIDVEIVTSDFSPEIVIDSAFFAIEKIDMRSDINVDGYELDAEQIVSTETEGGFFFEDVPPALYSRMTLKLNKPNPNSDLPDAFGGEPLSLLLEGSALLADGTTVPLRIQDRLPFPNINVVFLQGIDLLPGDKAQISLEGQIESLFAGVAFDSVQGSDLTDGELFIDLSDQPFLNEHPNLEEIASLIKKNLEITFTVTPL
jgi:hypothetical protein